MYVTRKRHQQMILIFGVVILALLTLFALASVTILHLQRSNTAHTTWDQTNTPESSFLHEEEVIIIKTENESEEDVILPIEKILFEYVEVVDGCGKHFEGECLNVRSGPGTEYPIIANLRNEIVLKVGGKVEHDGQTWYKIVFDEYLFYPERVTGDWYIASQFVQVLFDEGDKTIWKDGKATTTKRIVVNRTEQKLYAYEGEELFMESAISTGLALTPTPRGTFTIFKKTPSRYMQGPLPGFSSDQYYDLPGVPWNLYFTNGGAVIHGAYWHDSFGSTYSHGCVNLPPQQANILYTWAELGTEVEVRD